MRRHTGFRARAAATIAAAAIVSAFITAAPGAPAVAAHQVITAVWPVGGGALWASTQADAGTNAGPQGVEVTLNGGSTWTNVTPPGLSRYGGDHFILETFALTESLAWVVWGGVGAGPETLSATTDGGRSWRAVGRLPSADCTLQFVTSSAGTCTTYGAAAGSEAVAIWRTATGGATWTKVYDDRSAALTGGTTAPGYLPFACDKQIDFTGSTTGWALFYCNGPGYVMYRTSDAGRTWHRVSVHPSSLSLAGGGGFSAPLVLRGADGAVAFSTGHAAVVYVTRDGGRSFRPVDPTGPAREWGVDAVSPSHWVLVYADHVLTTTDAGATWHGFVSDAFAPEAHRSFAIATPDTVVFTSSNLGWLVWTGAEGDVLMRTTDGAHRWRLVRVPGT